MGLRDSSKCARLLAELKNHRVNVAAVQETHFICTADHRVLKNAGVFLLIGRSLDADVNVFAEEGDRGCR